MVLPCPGCGVLLAARFPLATHKADCPVAYPPKMVCVIADCLSFTMPDYFKTAAQEDWERDLIGMICEYLSTTHPSYVYGAAGPISVYCRSVKLYPEILGGIATNTIRVQIRTLSTERGVPQVVKRWSFKRMKQLMFTVYFNIFLPESAFSPERLAELQERNGMVGRG